tara:strand:- start:1309 stop:2106 length:798 start_codon:yes stop_codon:yes gene_type:complete
MLYKGVLTKMESEFSDPVNYYLRLNNDFIQIHQLIQKKLKLKLLGFQCLNCGSDASIYRQGFCKSCFFESPKTADWIMRPEMSKAHLGIEDRNIEFEKEVQLQPHIVYLANSSNVKVGVTRKTQVPTRWIDQGATTALEILEVPNRYLAGLAEVTLKNHISDKTNWREMLKGNTSNEDLFEWGKKLKKHLPNELRTYILNTQSQVKINFPVKKHPSSPKSLNLIKTIEYEGQLSGIKGQYLIFEDDTVFNIRSNEGLILGLDVLN